MFQLEVVVDQDAFEAIKRNKWIQSMISVVTIKAPSRHELAVLIFV